jgi:hypothetical protein
MKTVLDLLPNQYLYYSIDTLLLEEKRYLIEQGLEFDYTGDAVSSLSFFFKEPLREKRIEINDLDKAFRKQEDWQRTAYKEKIKRLRSLVN